MKNPKIIVSMPKKLFLNPFLTFYLKKKANIALIITPRASGPCRNRTDFRIPRGLFDLETGENIENYKF